MDIYYSVDPFVMSRGTWPRAGGGRPRGLGVLESLNSEACALPAADPPWRTRVPGLLQWLCGLPTFALGRACVSEQQSPSICQLFVESVQGECRAILLFIFNISLFMDLKITFIHFLPKNRFLYELRGLLAWSCEDFFLIFNNWDPFLTMLSAVNHHHYHLQRCIFMFLNENVGCPLSSPFPTPSCFLAP